ncbi:MAG: oxidoreductase [Carboxylicivirga sp.]|jgi:NAD(P)-dependent dehydrogenase (short-subunit alcohol dehydrogenase family)|nr:oxidoreductase [Carboxylicivirga sp.]
MTKTILITGASSGIGKETARLFLQKGYVVYGAARRLEKMKDIKALGVRLLKMDVTDDASIVAGIDQIISTEGQIDVLVNNAGYGSYGALEDVPLNEARYQFEVNLFGLARLCQLVIPHMRQQKAGRIINISSIGGEAGEPHGSWYHAAKFAVEGLSDSIRMELKQFGIKVVVIQPGAIKTEWNTIARENLLKVSGHTVYGELVRQHTHFLKSADEGSMASEPIVIAKAIAKAAETNNPRTRYAVGGGAKIAKIMRRILSDKAHDKMMLGLIKRQKV